MNYITLRLILGDQLNNQHHWYKKKNDDVLYVIMEVRQETDYVKHHIQKILAFFASMRHFANHLSEKGHHVKYLSINDKDNLQSISDNINALIQKHKIQKFEYQLPDEYRLDEQLHEFSRKLPIEFEAVDTDHFLTSRYTLSRFFQDRKKIIMVSFYRQMRKDTGILMNNDKPEKEKWNFDTSNRKKWKGEVELPEWPVKTKDLSDIKKEIEASGITTFGNADAEKVHWPTSRDEALKILNQFCDKTLPYFGTYQDAMTEKSPVLFHSMLSFALNTKMLHPLEVVKKVEKAYYENENVDIAQAEGFIRQIIGWREFMRGIYWKEMPGYANTNFFNHKRKLPSWYWNGKTKMNCLKHAIGQSLDTAYAHHIQRLMVTGNFALLAEINPDEVDQWYLGIYADAIEWVEITNTRGMSQYADGGIVGTKPYISSASYIHKMSDYCEGCYYKQSKKTGEKSCPFNTLYWHFLDHHRDKLEDNQRMRMMYNVWDKRKPEDKNKILEQARKYLDDIENL